MQPNTASRTVEVYAARQVAPNDAAICLWRHNGFDEPGGFVQIWTARRTTPGKKSRLFEPGERWFAHDQLDEAWDYAQRMDRAHDLNGVGREVYFSAHRLIDPTYGRVKENAASVRALWADIDTGDVKKTKPSAIVETSRGRFHGYWRLDRWIAPHIAEDLNQRLALHIGADGSGWDLTQILRVPGTHNYSTPDFPTVNLVHLEEWEG